MQYIITMDNNCSKQGAVDRPALFYNYYADTSYTDTLNAGMSYTDSLNAGMSYTGTLNASLVS